MKRGEGEVGLASLFPSFIEARLRRFLEHLEYEKI